MARREALTIGHRMRFLVPNELEARLARLKPFFQPPNGWNQELKEVGIFVDLSLVEWVDLGSLVQVVLLVESALRSQITVTVAPPLTRAQRSELELLEQADSPEAPDEVKRSIEHRIAVSSFLEYMQFLPVLNAGHLESARGNLRIATNYDPSARYRNRPSSLASLGEWAGVKSKERISPERELLYMYCFPLQWFSGTHSEDLSNMARFRMG